MTRVQTLSLAIGVALAALAVGWMAGRATNDSPTVGTSVDAAATERKVLYYRNPMGLPDTSPVPKKDPMGMDYVPVYACLLYTSPSPRDLSTSRMPSSA